MFVINSHALGHDSTNVKKIKYELKIELPKYTYKKYEPVNLKIVMINHDSIPLELWGNFESPFYLTDAEITDEQGKIHGVNQSRIIDAFLTAPTSIIPPQDSFFVSMTINNWGKEVPQKENIYFGNRGYFEKGKYTANITTSVNSNSEINIRGKNKSDTVKQPVNKTIIRSNEVYFEVIELNDTDRDIIKQFEEGDYLYNIKPYNDIINSFPNNEFTEIIYIYYLGGKYSNYYSDKNYRYINDLENDYEDFKYKYPNSLYLLNFRVVIPYIYRYFVDINTNMLKNDFEQLYLDFLFQNKYNMLKYFLKNKRRVKMILGIE